MKPFFPLVLGLVVSSCSDLGRQLCGDIPKEQRILLDSIETVAGSKAKFATIPCESNYINVRLAQAANDTVLYAMHDLLIQSGRLPWTTLDVYNHSGQQLYQQWYDVHEDRYYRVGEAPR